MARSRSGSAGGARRGPNRTRWYIYVQVYQCTLTAVDPSGRSVRRGGHVRTEIQIIESRSTASQRIRAVERFRRANESAVAALQAKGYRVNVRCQRLAARERRIEVTFQEWQEWHQ